MDDQILVQAAKDEGMLDETSEQDTRNRRRICTGDKSEEQEGANRQ